jgi:hypothetical protein
MSDEEAAIARAGEPASGSALPRPYLLFVAGVGSWTLAAGMQQVLFTWLLVGAGGWEVAVTEAQLRFGRKVATSPSACPSTQEGSVGSAPDSRRTSGAFT